MNKANLIEKVAETTDLNRTQATQAVEAVLDGIVGALKNGDDVRIVGFGTFSSVHRPASEGHNPRTGQKIPIAAKNQPKFKPGKPLKDALN